MVGIKGEKVATVAVTLVANTCSKTCRSSAYSVSVPREIPALAMTTSIPCADWMKSAAACASAA